MKALTLWRPWPWSILHGSKRIENRPWMPPRSVVGQRIALHAGKTYDYDGAKAIRSVHPAMPASADDHPLGIVGVATVSAAMLAADARLASPGMAAWIFGPCCWVLADVIALPKAIPCKGAQGLWPMPDDVERQVEEALASLENGVARG